MNVLKNLKAKIKPRSKTPNLTSTFNEHTETSTNVTTTGQDVEELQTVTSSSHIDDQEVLLTKQILAPVSVNSLWDQAYDILLQTEPELMKRYEALLQVELLQATPTIKSTPGGLLGSNHRQEQFNQASIDALRVNQNKGVIHIGQREISIVTSLRRVGTLVQSLKPWIDSALVASPQISVAWSVICLALPALSKPAEAEYASTDGFAYVTSRMRYYIAMEALLLTPSANAEAAYQELQKHVLELYTHILMFQVKCIIRFNYKVLRTWFDDIRSVENWSEMRGKIEAQEKLILDETQTIALQQSKESLDSLAINAKEVLAEMHSLLKVAQESRNIQQKSLNVQQQTLQTQVQTGGIQQESLIVQQQMLQNQVRVGDRDTEQKCLGILYQSSYEKSKRVLTERVTGTCNWFLTHTAFTDWLENDRILLLTAAPGCGKSVLAKYLIDTEIPQHHSCSDANICYFFFKDPTQQMLKQALCAVLHQILSKDQRLLKYAVLQLHKGKLDTNDNEEALIEIINNVVADQDRSPLIFIFDALDECQDSTGLMNLVRDLQNKTPKVACKFLLTSRQYEQIMLNFNGMQVEDYIKIHVSADGQQEVINSEVKLVIKDRVMLLCRSGRLKNSLQDELERILTSYPNPTYLWVHLALHELEHGSAIMTKRSLDRAMKDLPLSVNAAYEKILARTTATEDSKTIAYTAFCAILAAIEPLGLKQVQCAVNLRRWPEIKAHEELELDDEAFVDQLGNSCGLLLQIQGDQITFLHKTARDFLCENMLEVTLSEISRPPWAGSISLPLANRVMVEVCLQYLSLSDFATNLYGDQRAYPMLNHSAENWDTYFRSADLQHLDSLLNLLSILNSGERFEVWKDARRRGAGPKLPNHVSVACWIPSKPMLNYALKELNPKEREAMCQSSFLAIVRSGNVELAEILLVHGADQNIRSSGQQSAVEYSIRLADPAMLRLLLNQKTGLNLDYLGRKTTLLHIAIDLNRPIHMALLLEHGINLNIRDKSGSLAIQHAMNNSSEDMILPLLELHISRTQYKLSGDLIFELLCIATLRQLYRVMDRLLTQKEMIVPRFNKLPAKSLLRSRFDGPFRPTKGHGPYLSDLLMRADSKTVLQLAVLRSDYQAAKILLAHGVKTDTLNKCGDSAIHVAICLGLERIFDLLLEYLGHTIGPNSNGRLAEHMVFHSRNPHMLKYFLDQGFDLNCKNEIGRTPLQILIIQRYRGGTYVPPRADASRDKEFWRLVFQNITDINAIDHIGKTALLYAVETGDVYTTRLLLDEGADFNKADNEGITPLYAAVTTGELEIARLLLAHNASTTVTSDGLGDTGSILHVAVTSKIPRKDMVKLLLQHNIDANITDRRGKTPLHLLWRQGDLEIIKCLHRHGANFSRADAEGNLPRWKGRLMKDCFADWD